MSSSAATPRPLQVATLSTFLLLLVLCHQPLALASPSPFPKDLAPLNVVGPEQSYLYPGFQGLTSDNNTVRLGLDFQRMLRINHMLYIAARDHVFAVNLTTTTEQIVPQQQLTWRSKDVKMCAVRGRNSDECYNYIKVLVPRNDETLFACGTNAFNPGCRNYKMDTLEQVGEELVGQARCPFESHQSNVGIFAGGNFYSATMTDFLASDAVIYRSLGGEGSPVLRTVKYDSKWLREPRFLHAIEYGNYVYFFFSEIAVEYTSLGKVVFSRVARVCKNDGGGSPRVLDRYWTSFLKARLNCSLPGDSFFYFDVMQSLSNVLQINQRPAVIGVFTTQMNSIPGSAVCAFYMDDIERTFNGKFKEQKTSESAWTPVAEEQVPKPRPGSCAGDGPAAAYTSSTSFPDDMLTFIKSYPLMDEAVPSVGERPLFVRSASRYKLTQMAVDTSAGPYKNRTVLFLASEDGHVLKVLASTDPNATSGSTLLEDIDVYNPSKCDVQGDDRRVLGLELDKEHHALFVAFSTCVIRVPLSRCRNYGTCKRSCLASQDPYCVWLKTGSCASVTPGFKAGFEQDIEGDHSKYPDTCHNVLATTRNQNSAADSAYGVKGAPEMDKASHSVHYTLLIACVLVAFVLGAFLSAFVVSCYCSHSAHRHGQQRSSSSSTHQQQQQHSHPPSHPQLQQQQHSHHQQQQQQQLQQLQPVPERSVSRQPSQRQSLIRMGSSAGAGGAIPRQRSSMSQWPAAQQRLVRVSSGSGGGYEIGEASRPLIPSAGGGGGGTCLTRQHSYSEPPHMHRAAMVRRTASLKPQLPPKPLLLPASSPLGQQGKFNY
ncbi:semaphorin-6D-like [Alosa alosa]|nr:semaphorin-6D-like [Alosa alosa]